MPTQAPAGPDTRQAILDGARERFHRFGARKTTMGEVARQAGCSRATLYAHFHNKEELYAGLLDRDHEAFVREVEAAIADATDARQKLRRMVEIARAVYARNDVLRLAATADGEMTLEPVARAAMARQGEQVIGILRRVLEAGVAEGSLRPIDPERVAYLMYHLGTVLVARETSGERDYPFEEIMGVMDDVFNYGIANPKRGA